MPIDIVFVIQFIVDALI